MMLLMSQASFAHAIIGESIIYRGGGEGNNFRDTKVTSYFN